MILVLQGKSSEVFVDAELSTATDPADFQVFVKDVPFVVIVVHVDVSVHHQVWIGAIAMLAYLFDVTIE